MSYFDLAEVFHPFDSLPAREGYVYAIDASQAMVGRVDEWARKLAEAGPGSMSADPPGTNRYVRLLGALAQMWKAPELSGIPQRPSSLGQMAVMGGVGALAGYGLGSAVDRVLPKNDIIRARQAGAVLGGLAGMVPGLTSAYFNSHQGKNPWTESFWDNPKTASWPSHSLAHTPINVQQFQNALWSDPRVEEHLPLHLRAAASGLVQGAANLPGRPRNSTFVTPVDIARVAIGMGSGLASGWLVGKTLGAVFGTGQKTQDLLKNTGMAVGALKAVIPLAYGSEPYRY